MLGDLIVEGCLREREALESTIGNTEALAQNLPLRRPMIVMAT